MPTEIPGVVVVTATGAAEPAGWYSTYGNVTDVTAPGGSRFQTPDLRLRAWPGAGDRTPRPPATSPSRPRLGRLVQDADGNYYAWLNGTSMAAPHAVGVVALIRAAHPGMSRGAVVALLRSTATGQACPTALDPGVDFFGAPVQHCSGGVGSNNFYGKGLVNALAASR